MYFNMRATIKLKLILLIFIIALVPLFAAAGLAYYNIDKISKLALLNIKKTGEENLASVKEAGIITTKDSEHALADLAKESLKIQAQEIAEQIADFLSERDNDILLLKELPDVYYRDFLKTQKRAVFQGENKILAPIYKEIAVMGADGEVKEKYTNEGYDGKDFRLENYKSEISDLKNGDIWVSRLWGEYKEKSTAYAGVEMIEGEKYEGYYRWITPIYKNGKKEKYISLKMDARHLMEFTDYASPGAEEAVELPDAQNGNFAFLVDDEGWIISHPREYFIKGVEAGGKLKPPLDVGYDFISAIENAAPFKFGNTDNSEDFNNIHKVFATNGQSGSFIYNSTAEKKSLVYAPVPYFTGVNYSDNKLGFGWVGLESKMGDYVSPVQNSEKKIQEIANYQEDAISKDFDNSAMLIQDLRRVIMAQNIILIFASFIMALIFAFMFSRSISWRISHLKNAVDKAIYGDAGIQIPNPKANDEIGDLSSSIEALINYLKNNIKG